MLDFLLTKCDVSAIDGSVAAGAALGVQLDPAHLAHGVAVHTLPDAHRGLHFLTHSLENGIFGNCQNLKTNWTLELRFPECNIYFILRLVHVTALLMLVEEHLFQQLVHLVEGVHLVIVLLLGRTIKF